MESLFVVATMSSFRCCVALFIYSFATSVTVSAINYPVGVSNCGESNWVNATPARAVALNQAATEVMLALNLTDRMVGTGPLDDAIWEELADRYAQVPVLAVGSDGFYPDVDTLIEVNPDFLYGSYSSAFSTKYVNYSELLGGPCSLTIQVLDYYENETYCRKELHEFGIQTYLQSSFCEKIEHREESKISTLFAEIWDVANIFDAHEQARIVIDSIDFHFDQAKAVAGSNQTSDSVSPKILWFDSYVEEDPFVGACCGSIGIILEHAGAINIFGETGRDDLANWATATWDEVAAKDPDLIVLIDASWSTADEKLYNLCRSNVTRNLRAVQNRAFIVVPFSGSTLGVRVGTTAYNLAEAMTAITRNEVLSNAAFTDVNLTLDGNSGGQGVSRSGVRVYTRLPVFNNTDLELFCPGESNIVIGEKPVTSTSDSDNESNSNGKSTNSSSIPKWSIALLSVLGAGLFISALVLGMVLYNEKKGKPLFSPQKMEAAVSC